MSEKEINFNIVDADPELDKPLHYMIAEIYNSQKRTEEMVSSFLTGLAPVLEKVQDSPLGSMLGL